MDDITEALFGLRDCDSVKDLPEETLCDNIARASPLLDAVSKDMASEVNTDITGKRRRRKVKRKVNVVNEIQSMHQMEMNTESTEEIMAPANGILGASDSVTEAVPIIEKAEQPRLDFVPKENGSEVNTSMKKKKRSKKKVNQIEMNMGSTEDLVEVKVPTTGNSGAPDDISDYHVVAGVPEDIIPLKDVTPLEIAEQPRLDVVPKEYGSEGNTDTTKKRKRRKRKKKVAVISEIQCMHETEENMGSTENLVEIKSQMSCNVGASSNTSDYNVVANNEPEKNLPDKEEYRRPSGIKHHEYEMIRADTALGLSPVKYLSRLKNQEKSNYSGRKHVYNARQKLRRKKMGGIPALGYFFSLILENRWYERHRCIAGTNQIGDIFFADTRSILLSEQFSEVLLIHVTYKTNIWKLPLVEIIGFVPTGENYHVAFAFIHDEMESSYSWVLQQLWLMLLDVLKTRIFVTDRELPLMNAIKIQYPKATNLLCRRHIATDVHKYLTKVVKSKKKEADLSECWQAIVHARSEEEYISAVMNLEEAFVKYPKFIRYVQKTWLTKYHEKFVACWVDEHMHSGAVTSNMVKSAHAQLKNVLHSSQENFHLVFEAIVGVVSRQLSAIKTAFGKARSKVNPYASEGFHEVGRFGGA